MAGDPTTTLLIAALRRIRRSPGRFDKQRLAPEPLLVEYLGSGDLDQAWEVVERLIARYGSHAHGDITAFFFTSGLGVTGDTLDARLRSYAAQNHVDERTALRRSDRGALKIATMLRHGLELERPLARIVVFQSGDTISSWLDLVIEAGSEWRPPEVEINGRIVDDLDIAFSESVIGPRYLSSLTRLPDAELDLSAEEFDPLASVRTTWSMPIWPSWDLNCHIVDDRLYARLQVDRNGVGDVGVCWIRDDVRTLQGGTLRASLLQTSPYPAIRNT